VAELSWSILCFSGIDWDYNRQRPHWIMSSLAERGASVLYVDNVGLRLPRPADLRRVIHRLSIWADSSRRPSTEVRPRILRDAPIVPPLQHFGPIRRVASRMLVRRLGPRLGPQRPLIVWTYLPAPAIADAAEALGADLLVYDWADDASVHILTPRERHRRRVAAWEDQMLARADVVFVASEELLRRRGSPNPRTFLVPHGVPFLAEDDPPALVLRAPRPRIGFVGTLSEWVDFDLLKTVVAARPGWSFVFVGPVRTQVKSFVRMPNVFALGPRPHEEIGGVLSALDVALIPYRLTAAMSVASPVKLHEYLAKGLPVVSTDLPEVRPYSPPVRIASGAEAFLSAIEEGLEQGHTSPRAGTAWDQRVDTMVDHVMQTLADKKR
jgi:glycosyltransferase involved in cell wall biosynthesis